MINRELEQRFECRDVNLLEAVLLQAGLGQQAIRCSEDCPGELSPTIASFAHAIEELFPRDLHAHWLSPFIEQIAKCCSTHNHQAWNWDTEDLATFTSTPASASF